MAGGYLYSEYEPKKRCPYCGASCHADFVDVGVGMQQCGPYHCERCGACEIGAFDTNTATPEEVAIGWYKSQAGSSANVDEQGNVITHYEADTLYRKSVGVSPRYDGNGRLLRCRKEQ